MRTGKIHYAKLSNSPRLKRLYELLLTGREYTTMEIIKLANICAVNSAVTELRMNNIHINCRVIDRDATTGSSIYGYQLQEAGQA